PALLRGVGVLSICLWEPAPHAHDLLPRIEEQIGDPDSLVQQAAWIGAEIEHQRPHSTSEKARYRAIHLFCGRITERLEIDVADTITKQCRPSHRALVNRHALHLEIDR